MVPIVSWKTRTQVLQRRGPIYNREAMIDESLPGVCVCATFRESFHYMVWMIFALRRQSSPLAPIKRMNFMLPTAKSSTPLV